MVELLGRALRGFVYLLLIYVAFVGLQLAFGWFAGAQLVVGVLLLVLVAAAARELRRRPAWPQREPVG